MIVCFLATCVGCDQLTKHAAINRLKGQAARSYCGDVVRLQYAENPGAFLGLGRQLPSGARWLLLIAVNAVVAAGLVVALLWHPQMPLARSIACALLLGGAIGNLIDRVRFDGLVIDFLNVGVGPLRTGIFNVADVAITAGAVFLVLPHFARPQAAPGLPPK